MDEVEMSREIAFFALVLSMNMGGRFDCDDVMKNADYQMKAMEKYGNACWPVKPEKENKNDKN
jgi:hypothetical protein